MNLYGFVGNNGIGDVDFIGLCTPGDYRYTSKITTNPYGAIDNYDEWAMIQHTLNGDFSSEGGAKKDFTSWKDSASAVVDGCRIKTSGSIKIKLQYIGTFQEYQTAKNAAGELVKEHENTHVEDTKKHWNEMVSNLNWINGPDGWFTSGCAKEAKNILDYFNKRRNLYSASAQNTSCEYDEKTFIKLPGFVDNSDHAEYVTDYHKRCDGAASALKVAQDEYAKSKKKMDEDRCAPGEK